MNPQELARREHRAQEDPLVISEIEDGFRVYSLTTPTKSYIVSGDPSIPTCTCPDFQVHRSDPEWRCKHILAVLPHVKVVPLKRSPQDAATAAPGTYEGEERAAIQAEGAAPKRHRTPRPTNGLRQIVLKRSVSPDGRIDSLSVEITAPIERLEAEEIKSSALKALTIQDGIVEGFRNGNGSTPKEAQRTEGEADTAVAARLVEIGGMNGKWGRRLFITVETNGKRLRLFGNREKLAAAIAAAGFTDQSRNIAEGAKLDLPCRVITQPTEDGKYFNIEKVLPPAAPQGGQR